MQLTILGGGGFRVPLVYRALLAAAPLVDSVVLHDTSLPRLRAIEAVLAGGSLPVRSTTSLDEALAGADFVFSAIRVGGLAGRVSDERVALSLGVLGQETTGPGGIAYALRTIPVALDIARRVPPNAHVINFTNPAGMITEAMRTVLGDRVIGICDTPSGLGARVARLAGVAPDEVTLDYVGLNHLGWLRGVQVDGRDVLADVLADDAALARLDETQLFGADWLRSLGAIPNEYLHYYYFNREAIREIRAAGATRGEFLLAQQERFYAAAAAVPGSAADGWRAAHAEREATYLAEARGDADRLDLSGGGYERVAVDLMAALAHDRPATMILNVANGSTIAGLPADAVVEVPCTVDAAGVRPVPRSPVDLAQLGLMQQVKAVERLTIRAAVERDPDLALQAFALHPLVDSVSVARELVAGYGLLDGRRSRP